LPNGWRATLVWWDEAVRSATVGCAPPGLTEQRMAQVSEGCWTPAGDLVFEGRGSTRYDLGAATSGRRRGDAEVGRAIVDRRTGRDPEARGRTGRRVAREIDVLSQFRTPPLTPRTRKLLTFGAPRGAERAGNLSRPSQSTRLRRGFGFSLRPTFATARPSTRTTSAVKSFEPRSSDEPTP
jgi:hypothetical protein